MCIAGWLAGWMDEYVCVYNVAIMPYLASGGGKERKKDGRTDGRDERGRAGADE